LNFIGPPSNLNTKILLYAGPSNSMLVFCSRIGLEVLSKCSTMHDDGTFYVAAKYFYQLYLLHGWYNYYMIPCAWILMTKRRSVDYKKDQLII
jgi:hypothetical protein